MSNNKKKMNKETDRQKKSRSNKASFAISEKVLTCRTFNGMKQVIKQWQDNILCINLIY